MIIIWMQLKFLQYLCHEPINCLCEIGPRDYSHMQDHHTAGVNIMPSDN